MQNSQVTTDQILQNLNIAALNDMQHAAIETIKQQDNTIILSATGSGKTLAFLLPVLQLLDINIKKQTQVLIIAPSRELAQQIENVFKTMGTGISVTCCYGGHKREIEENNLLEAPTLIVGTPGRLADHIRRNNIKPETIHTLVLDEFDKSLELGFEDEVAFIVNSLTGLQKRVLTSATSAEDIPVFLGMQKPAILNYVDEDAGDESLAIQSVMCDDRDKLQTLFRLLCYLGSRPSIIFCNHREAVERTSKYLTEQGILNVYYHGAMEQKERDAALNRFRNGSSSFLVTTDIAARGLDIANIRYIIHYHLPHTADIFTHRNGRTARMDKTGTAILLIGPDEKMPDYAGDEVTNIQLPEHTELPEKPKWITLFVAAGKKDKVNKVDIVGFLTQRGEMKKEDIGLIEVKDFFSFVAIRKSKATHTLHLIKDQRLKNKKIKIEIAR